MIKRNLFLYLAAIVALVITIFVINFKFETSEISENAIASLSRQCGYGKAQLLGQFTCIVCRKTDELPYGSYECDERPLEECNRIQKKKNSL
ncbi:MAG: hypothetical protein ABII13_02745 [Patescibacteria group bacterium]|nr:hypothetical protein [Patescibacteria group bacterium]MBU2509588.1 hypothetical protein [Patescibacteria group bacterium]